MISQSTPATKGNILVIDDTPENLHLLSNLLTEQGYKVRSVTKGSSAIRGAQSAPPDLILLDIAMPEMDGYEVCQQLKNSDRTRDIPVIFISAMDDVLDKVKAFTVGGVDYITKPFQVKEVLARIENHLTLRNLQKQLQEQNIRLQQEIHERQQAEEKFAKAFRSSPSPIAITRFSDHRLIEVNNSFLRLGGYSLEESLEQSIDDLNLNRERYNLALQQLLETGFLYNQEIEFQTKSGDIRTVLLSIEKIDISGVQCALNIINDITERKRLENAFISLVSHELRTPLMSLLGALDLVSAGQFGTLNAQGQKVLKIATTNTERLTRLVNNILDLEHMKSGTIALHCVNCNLADLLLQATETMQAMADQAQVTLVTELLSVELWVDCDRILQTLMNLLSNAIKFSPPHSTILLKAELIENEVLICLKDQGRGIPTDKLNLIFDRFQQVDPADSRKKGGTGLGLAICRNIIEQHQGRIWAESILGQGSTFWVILPLNPNHQNS